MSAYPREWGLIVEDNIVGLMGDAVSSEPAKFLTLNLGFVKCEARIEAR